MEKIKLLYVCILIAFLDVAILPFGCRPKEKEKIMFEFEIYENSSIHAITKNPIQTDLRVGDTITAEQFEELYDYFVDDISFYYYAGYDQPEYNVEVKSFSIKSIHLAKEQHTFDEVTIPYTFEEGDFCIYYQSIRNVLVYKVVLYADYELTPKE